MLEINQSINTWPQLASAVTMGGGITADVSRRILLGHFSGSGRFYVDIEELIGDEPPQHPPLKKVDLKDEPEAAVFAARAAGKPLPEQVNLEKRQAEQLAAAACIAPSGGNWQPWRWVYKNNCLHGFIYSNGESSFLGHNNYPQCIAMGAAAQNVMVKAGELGFDCKVEIFPDNKVRTWQYFFAFFPAKAHSDSKKHMAAAIEKRLTNRTISKRQELRQQDYENIQSSVNDIEGITLQLFKDEEKLALIGEVVADIDLVRFLEADGHSDFVREIRWTPEEAERTRNGIDLRTIDLTNTEKIGLQVAKDEQVMEYLRQWKGGGAFRKLTLKAIGSASAVGILITSHTGRKAFVKGGMALQNLWLTATTLGIGLQPLSSSVFMYARLFEGGAPFSGEGERILRAARERYVSAFEIPKDSREIFIFRLSKSDDPEVKSLRFPLDKMFCYV